MDAGGQKTCLSAGARIADGPHYRTHKSRAGGAEQDMESYRWNVRIHSGHVLDEWMREYLGCTEMCLLNDGTTVLSGTLPDLAAVYHVVLGLRDACVSLLSIHIHRKEKEEGMK